MYAAAHHQDDAARQVAGKRQMDPPKRLTPNNKQVSRFSLGEGRDQDKTHHSSDRPCRCAGGLACLCPVSKRRRPGDRAPEAATAAARAEARPPAEANPRKYRSRGEQG